MQKNPMVPAALLARMGVLALTLTGCYVALGNL